MVLKAFRPFSPTIEKTASLYAPYKLNETARSYKTITLETKELVDFTFVWFTDGQGWKSARNNLEETFDVLEHIYNISDMENGIINEVMK